MNEHEPTLDEDLHVPRTSITNHLHTLSVDGQIHNDDSSYQHNVCNELMNTDDDLEGDKSLREEGCQRRLQSIRDGECYNSRDLFHESFRQEGDVRKHKRKRGGDRHYLCDVCNKLFSRQCVLKKHQRIRIGEHPTSSDVCRKSFTQKADLTRHLRIRTGERPLYVMCVTNHSL